MNTTMVIVNECNMIFTPNITAELLKHGGESIIEWLRNIINAVWVSAELPTDWTRDTDCIILFFWKREGVPLVCSNHRGITLLSLPGKLFARILLDRAVSHMHAHRRPQQAGFMPNRSTTDYIFAIRLLIENFREFRKERSILHNIRRP